MFSAKYIQEGLRNSPLNTTNKAYAKLCDINVDAIALHHFAYISLKSLRIQIHHRLQYGPQQLRPLSSKAIAYIEYCKQSLKLILVTNFPDDTDPALISLHKFCSESLIKLENYKIYE